MFVKQLLKKSIFRISRPFRLNKMVLLSENVLLLQSNKEAFYKGSSDKSQSFRGVHDDSSKKDDSFFFNPV